MIIPPTSPLRDLHHDGVVVQDAIEAADQYHQQWGFSITGRYDFDLPTAIVNGTPAPFSARYVFLSSGATIVELIQPLSRPSPYSDFLAAQGEGVHHLAYYVADFDERLAVLRRSGRADSITVTAQIAGQNRFAYIHGLNPGPAIELVEITTPNFAS